MKILYVNDNDLAGRRFNGHDLQIMLNKAGFEAKQFVVSKAGDDKNTLRLLKTEVDHFIREKCKEFEERISMQSVIYPFGELLGEEKEFKDADIVHYHLIFNHFISLFSFRKLAQTKPTVWSLHDPWALTGHCVHPIDCKGWLTGCKNCPYLERYSPLHEDNASSIWNIKKDIYTSVDIDIVVASKWMYELVKKSPLTMHFKRVHFIPFGIDLDIFKKRKNKTEIRNRLGIKENNFVMMFRQDDQEFKGLDYIKLMLDKLDSKKTITLLTVGKTGLLKKYRKKYQIIEYKWVNDNNQLIELYSAADLFLMPSIAESFGMMAIEAMACSLPVIVFEGTALPDVTFAPNCGISLRKGDTNQFIQTVVRLISSPRECKERGGLGRKLAEEKYNIIRYNTDMIKLYQGIFNRNKNGRN